MIPDSQKDKLRKFVEEDVGSGDITTALVPESDAIGTIEANESCILAGLEEAEELFKMFECRVHSEVKDGDFVNPGKVLEVFGSSSVILKVERTALNLLGRMSGIATLGKQLQAKAEEVNKDVRVVGTRKTAPGLNAFDKKAVKLGTGFNHRINLSDSFLIKENHLGLIDIEEAVEKALRDGKHKVEVEVKNEKELVKAAKAGAQIIMLDNFEPEGLEKAVKRLEHLGLRGKAELEASGGIVLGNIQDYAKYVDIISVGALTHSVKSIDFSLSLAKA